MFFRCLSLFLRFGFTQKCSPNKILIILLGYCYIDKHTFMVRQGQLDDIMASISIFDSLYYTEAANELQFAFLKMEANL